MKNPLVNLARNISEASGRSGTVPGLVPLSKVQKAVVFVDASKPGFLDLVAAVHKFFDAHKIVVNVFAINLGEQPFTGMEKGFVLVGKKRMSWYGTAKPYLPDEQLFIDLTEGDIYATRNAAIRSVALVKMARRQLPHGEINLEITASEQYSQMQVFDTLCKLLEKIN